jgi:hypothetical protein
MFLPKAVRQKVDLFFLAVGWTIVDDSQLSATAKATV